MSENCGCTNELNAVDKIRLKGFSNENIPQAFKIQCACNESFIMTTHEAKCPSCHMVYGVTPCSADNVENVVAVGVSY